MTPNVVKALKTFEQTIVLRKSTQSIVDFLPVQTFVDKDIKAVVTTASMEQIQAGEIDFSKKYLQVTTEEVINITDQIVWHGNDFKCFQSSDNSDYGFYNCIFEEIKKGDG